MLVYSLGNIRVGLEERQIMLHQRTEILMSLLSLLLLLEYLISSHKMYRHVTQKSISYIRHETIGWLDSTYLQTDNFRTYTTNFSALGDIKKDLYFNLFYSLLQKYKKSASEDKINSWVDSHFFFTSKKHFENLSSYSGEHLPFPGNHVRT